MATEPVTPDELRRRTTARVVRRIRESGAEGRAALAAATGLAKTTVGAVVGDLLALGLVEEDTTGRGGPGGSGPVGRGRPVRPVRLRGGLRCGLGVEVNVDYVAAAVVDLDGSVRSREVRPVGDTDRQEKLLGLLDDVLPVADRPGLLAVVVAVPGLVDVDRRHVTWTPNLRIDTAGLERALVERLGPVPVHVDNDASCAAWGETRHGVARGTEHLVYLTGTVGVGAGIVADGTVLRGSVGNAGEVGHMPLGHPGTPCGCGRTGCWETAVGLPAMLAATGRERVGDPATSAAAVAADATDAVVRAGLGRLADDLARGLAVLVGVVDPEVVVLGGYFAALGAHLLDPAATRLDELLASPAQRRPALLAGRLGTGAAAVGAAELALEPVLTGAADLT